MGLQKAILAYMQCFQSGQLSKPPHCQSCGKGGSLRWHGQYHRGVITLTQVYTIPIKRLFCSLCRHTFGLFPSFVEKFHRYAKKTIQRALKRLTRHTYEAVANWFMSEGNHYIATLTLYLWRRKFA